jgi:hypothetical protein
LDNERATHSTNRKQRILTDIVKKILSDQSLKFWKRGKWKKEVGWCQQWLPSKENENY